MPFFPKTNNEVSQFLSQRRKSPLHISGGENDYPNTEILSTSHLNSVLLYEPEEMITSVQSGILLKELEKTLATNGQWIPTLVADESLENTLGAAVAMDHFHPRAKNCGMLRTTILGGTFCTTSGEVFKSGSRVVKSVAGYDIHRAFCGSRGLFGIILDLTLKVQPKPEMVYRFIAPLDLKEKLLRFHPTCLEEFEGKLLVEFAGYKEDLEYDMKQVKSFGIDELDIIKWNEAMNKLIQLRNKENAASLPSDVEALLKNVRQVFDPEGVLL